MNLNEAIIHWVEHGLAPEQLLAEKRDPTGKLLRTRPLFPYPNIAKYKGTGDPNEAASFVSVLGAQ